LLLGDIVKKKIIKEFLDTKKSKVTLTDITTEDALSFEKAMFYAEKYVGSELKESKEDDEEELDPEDPTSSEIDFLQKSLRGKKLDIFLSDN